MRRVLAGAGVALLLSLGLVAAACGDDDSRPGRAQPTLGPLLSLQEYYDEVAALDGAFAQRSRALNAGLEQQKADIESPEEAFDLARQFIGARTDVIESLSAGVAALTPPGELAEAHGAVVSGSDGLLVAFTKLVDRLSEVTSAETLDALLADDQLEAASVALQQACSALQALADENSMNVELDCASEV